MDEIRSFLLPLYRMCASKGGHDLQGLLAPLVFMRILAHREKRTSPGIDEEGTTLFLQSGLEGLFHIKTLPMSSDDIEEHFHCAWKSLTGEHLESTVFDFSAFTRILGNFDGYALFDRVQHYLANPGDIDWFIESHGPSAVFDTLTDILATDEGRPYGFASTPAGVNRLITDLAGCASDRISRAYDPACGFAGTLLAVKDLNPDTTLYGQEIHGDVWAIARMRSILKQIPGDQILRGDVIARPAHVRTADTQDRLETFDTVVSVIPPSVEIERRVSEALGNDTLNRFHRGKPIGTVADFVFISHMVESMDPNTGTMVIVCPPGVLFRGSGDGLLRAALVNENLIDCVIQLPGNVLYDSNYPPVCLVLKRKRSVESILCIDARTLVRKTKRLNFMESEAVNTIIDVYRERKESAISRIIDQTMVLENNTNLSVSRYFRSDLTPPETPHIRDEQELRTLWRDIEETTGSMEELFAKWNQIHPEDSDG